MNMLIYLILVNLCLAACYGFYHLFLRHETFHHANRWFLLGGIVAAYTLPVLQSEWVQSLFITQKVQASVQATEVYQLMLFLPKNEQGLTWSDMLLGIYIAGVTVGLIRLGRMFYQLKKQAQNEQQGEAWSFFGWRKIDPKLDGQNMIIEHESVHSRQGHSFDVLMAELLIILNWFNPVVYLMRISLRRLHEFMADAEASRQDKAAYAMLLLSRQFSVNPSVLAHSFMDMKQLKHRIMMMKKNPSRKSALLKYGLLLPLFGSILILSAATSTNKNPVVTLRNAVQDLSDIEVINRDTIGKVTVRESDVVYQRPDTIPDQPVKMPNPIKVTPQNDNDPISFASVEILPNPQGGMQGFGKYIQEHYNVPEDIRKTGIKTGRVTVSFIVEKDGDLSNIKVLRDLGYGTGEEAARVLDKMPAWKPGLQNGKPVRVAYTLPISVIVDNNGEGARNFTKDSLTKTPQYDAQIIGDPLYVIDGVPSKNEDFTKLKPEDIEEIKVVNSSSSRAIWGDKGKNGVVIIATKKGSFGKQQESETDLKAQSVSDNTTKSFADVEVLPSPQGGMAGFGKYVADNYKVPAAAAKSKSDGGRITVSFIVEKDGKLSDIKVLRDLGYGTGEEAVRILKNMPPWRPGMQNGKPVRVAYTLPIAVSLK